MEMAHDDVSLRQHIRAAYHDAGFTDGEWVELYQFKETLNISFTSHSKFDASEAYHIIHHCMAHSTSPSLRSGLNKTVGFYEQNRKNNWMFQYLNL